MFIGVISTSEMKNLLTTMGERFSKSELEDLFQNIPLVDNGKSVDYREFVKLIKHGSSDIKLKL